jgi:hypothetical protein
VTPPERRPRQPARQSCRVADRTLTLDTLRKAKDRPHALDDATIDRVEQVHTEQMDYVEIHTQQISRWRKEKPSAAQARELDRMDKQNQQLRALTRMSWPWPANCVKAPSSAYWG